MITQTKKFATARFQACRIIPPSLRSFGDLMLPKIQVILISMMVSPLTHAVHADDLFADRVAPLLERRCLNCHNDAQREGGWSLQTATSAFEDGYIQAGNAASSHLIDQIATINGKAEMPKDGTPLTDEEVNWIRDWINEGAIWPENRKLDAARGRHFE
ncbi:MAG: c-type cytochrome domain-containing protein, partial [Pirellula sp.]